MAEIKIAEEDRKYENDDNSLMERSRLMTVPLSSLSKDMGPSVINDSITTSGQLVEKPKEVFLSNFVTMRFTPIFLERLRMLQC